MTNVNENTRTSPLQFVIIILSVKSYGCAQGVNLLNLHNLRPIEIFIIIAFH